MYNLLPLILRIQKEFSENNKFGTTKDSRWRTDMQ